MKPIAAIVAFVLLFESNSLGATYPDNLTEDQIGLIVFLGVECPLAKLYSATLRELHKRYSPHGVKVVAVDANQGDSQEAIDAFASEFDLPFPFIRDIDNRLADELGASRSPEAFLILNGRVMYRGRIDDRYKPGDQPKSEPEQRYVEDAILDLINKRPVRTPSTEPVGCFIDKAEISRRENGVGFARVAGVLHQRCAECHRPGQVAPFSLLTYEDAKKWAATIKEVIEQGRMPPWGADPKVGHFANDRSLRPGEKRLLLDWIADGAIEGTEAIPEPPHFIDGWKIGTPDVVVTMPTPFAVPSEGIVEYQEITLDPNFENDTYVQAIEIRPGNPDVVHHVNAFLRPKDGNANTLYLSPAGDYYLGVFVPGNSVTEFGPGIGKLIPAGWTIVLNIHYVAVGTPQLDQTSIGFKVIEPDQVTHEAATRVLAQHGFFIEPHSTCMMAQSMVLEDDYTLVAAYPHMHLRGKSMLFDVVYPDGRVEEILNVPKYNFDWQFRYVLAKPKLLPKGTVLRCLAEYDNTIDNPNNPDPNATVVDGDQTTDEMFRGAWEIYRPLKPLRGVNYRRILVACAAAGILLAVRRRMR